MYKKLKGGIKCKEKQVRSTETQHLLQSEELKKKRKKNMEVSGEEERRSRREEEEKQVYYSILNSPCSAFEKGLQGILKCLGLDSSSSSVEEDPAGTETVEETGFMAKITGLLRRRPRPSYSSGRPGQIN